jgi:two-component system, cell cycle sensor histidine kinase and response regulator CckA
MTEGLMIAVALLFVILAGQFVLLAPFALFCAVVMTGSRVGDCDTEDLDGRETVLVAEDEDMVRNLACEVLQIHGYRVLRAASGEDALEICRTSIHPIDLLITDVVMPSMSGRALAERLEAQCPGIKVLYMSGYTDDVVSDKGGLIGSSQFIQKPFSIEELARKVRSVIDRKAPGG